MSPDLPSQRFRKENEDDWRQLEALLDRLDRGSLRRLSDEELLALPGLYRTTLSSLSAARATSLDQSLIAYLEALSTRAYFLVYGARVSLGQRLWRFFATDWPLAVRALWRETLAAWAIGLTGAMAAAWLVRADPGWFYVFVPQTLAGGRDPSASTEALQHSLYAQASMGRYSVLSATLMTHNAQIAISAFALGFAFCLPTVFLLAYNGAVLGAFAALFATRGLGWPLAAWLSVHGVTELSAVALAGAAGLRIGTAILMPGRLTRLHSAAEAGKQAAIVVAGCAMMLACAGLLEGIVRQAVTDPVERGAIGGATLLFWLAYFYGWRRR